MSVTDVTLTMGPVWVMPWLEAVLQKVGIGLLPVVVSFLSVCTAWLCRGLLAISS